MNNKNNDEDTQIRRALNVELLVDEEQESQLTRIADALNSLARDLGDLPTASQLREHAATMRAIAAGLPVER